MGKVGNLFQPVIPPALPSQHGTGEGRGVSEMMMDDSESEGYVSFPLGFYKLCQNFSKFYAKIMIFIQNTIFIFRVYIWYYLVYISCEGR